MNSLSLIENTTFPIPEIMFCARRDKILFIMIILCAMGPYILQPNVKASSGSTKFNNKANDIGRLGPRMVLQKREGEKIKHGHVRASAFRSSTS